MALKMILKAVPYSYDISLAPQNSSLGDDPVNSTGISTEWKMKGILPCLFM